MVSAFWEQQSVLNDTTSTGQPDRLRLFSLAHAGNSINTNHPESMIDVTVVCTVLTIDLCIYPVMFILGTCDSVAELGLGVRIIHMNFNFIPTVAPCGLRGCKNGPAPFPGRMSYVRGD